MCVRPLGSAQTSLIAGLRPSAPGRSPILAAAFDDTSWGVAPPLLDFSPQVADPSFYQPFAQPYDLYVQPDPQIQYYSPVLQHQPQVHTPRRRVKTEPLDYYSGLPTTAVQIAAMAANAGVDPMAAAEAAIAAAAAKPKRVRTGCLTCRERHLKCDEGLPTCMNCRKSARECKRGVRLNFIDTQCKQPPVVPRSEEWSVYFQDESRQIASEYLDGESQYPKLQDSQLPQSLSDPMNFTFQPASSNDQMMSSQPLPDIQGMHSNGHSMQQHSVNLFDQPRDLHQQQPPPGAQSVDSTYSHASLPSHHSHHSPQQPSPYDHQMSNSAQTEPEYRAEAKEILNTQEETLYMQVFVEEVGLWMDSMDSMKHVRE